MAGSPGGKEVGRVSVRAVPNTSGFKQRLETFLEGLRLSVRVDLDFDRQRPPPLPPVDQPVDTDTGEATREVELLHRRISSLSDRIILDADPTAALREYDRLASRLRALDFNIDVDADTARAMARARALARDIESQNVDVPVDLDTSQASSELVLLQRRMNGLRERILIDADPTEAYREFERLAARARAIQADVNVDADTARARAEIDRLVAEINRRRATIDVNVDTDRRGGAGLGALGGLGGIAGGLLGSLGKLPSLLGSVGGAFGGAASKGLAFGQSIQSAIGDVGGLLGSLGKAAPVVGAVGAGVLGLGLKFLGLGAQISAVLIVAGALTYALGAVGVAVGALPALITGAGLALGTILLGMDGIKAAFKGFGDDLKKSVSDVFEKGLKPVVENLTKNLLPTLKEEFGKNAEQLVGLADAAGKFITSTEGLNLVRTAFQGTREMITSMLPGLKLLAQGFIDVVNTRGLFTTFGEIIGGVAGRVGELFSKLATSGLLTQGLTLLRDLLFSVVDVITTLILKATEFFVAAGPGLQHVFEAIKGVIEQIDFTSLGESFGIFTDAVATLIESVPPSVWKQIADAVRDLALKFKELAEDPAIQQFFAGLIGTIPILIDSFTSFLGAVRAVLNFVRDMTAKVVSFFVDLYFEYLKQKRAVTDFVQTVKTKFQEAVQAVKDKVTQIKNDVREKFEQAKQFVKEKVEAARTAVRDGWTKIVTVVKDKAREVVAKARALPGEIKSALGNLGALLIASGRALIQGFINGIIGMIGAVRAAAGRVVAAARNLFPFSPAKEGPFSGRGWVLYSGLALGAAFAEGMDRQQGLVRSAAAGLLDGAATIFGETGAYAAAGLSAAEAYANGLGGVDTARDRIVAGIRADAAVAGQTDGQGRSSAAAAQADATDRLLAFLAAHGLKLDTEGGELIAKLGDAGGRSLDRRGRG